MNELKKRKEESLSRVITFTKWAIGIVLLQCLDFYLGEESDFRKTTIGAELGVLILILFVLIVLYLIDAAKCWEKNYQYRMVRLIKNKHMHGDTLSQLSSFGISYGDCVSLMLHPELTNHYNKQSFWGWGDDGDLYLENVNGDEKCISLGMLPWTCSEQKTIALTAKSRDKLNDYGEANLEDVKQILNVGNISYKNVLRAYPIFVRKNDKGTYSLIEGISEDASFDVTVEMLGTDSSLSSDELFDECFKRFSLTGENSELARGRAGIISIFQDCSLVKDNAAVIGLAVLIEVEGYEDNILPLTYSEAEELSTSGLSVYGLMLYHYAKGDIDTFAKEMISRDKLRDWHFNNLVSDIVSILKYRLSILYKARKYNVSHFFIDSPVKKGIIIAAFIAENILDPFISGTDYSANNLRALGVALALFVTFVLLCLSFYVMDKNESFDKTVAISSSLNHENHMVGLNYCMECAPSIIEGWDGDDIEIALAATSKASGDEKYNMPFDECQQKYVTEWIRNEKDDGTKYRFLNTTKTENGLVINVDKCKFTDTMMIQNMVKLLQKELGIRNSKKIEELRKEITVSREVLENDYNRYKNEIENSTGDSRKRAINYKNMPANSLCMHASIMTLDGYVLCTTRGKNVAYYPNAKDVSLEEQLNIKDFAEDGARGTNWVYRLLEEEMGISSKTIRHSKIADINILSIFWEMDCLNIALAAKIRLNATRREVEEIMENWPRTDFEFGSYWFEKLPNVIQECINSPEKIENENGVDWSYHPTAIYRLYLLALSEHEYDLAEKLRGIYGSTKRISG